MNNDENASKFCSYDMHDVKMVYMFLTQHSQWNRKHHPFLFCKCRKGPRWFGSNWKVSPALVAQLQDVLPLNQSMVVLI